MVSNHKSKALQGRENQPTMQKMFSQLINISIPMIRAFTIATANTAWKTLKSQTNANSGYLILGERKF